MPNTITFTIQHFKIIYNNSKISFSKIKKLYNMLNAKFIKIVIRNITCILVILLTLVLHFNYNYISNLKL